MPLALRGRSSPPAGGAVERTDPPVAAAARLMAAGRGRMVW